MERNERDANVVLHDSLKYVQVLPASTRPARPAGFTWHDAVALIGSLFAGACGAIVALFS